MKGINQRDIFPLRLIIRDFMFLMNLINLLTLSTLSYSINVFPDKLSSEEENKLLIDMMNGDTNARNKLIEHNLRLVAHIVKKFESVKQDINDDLISIGTIGLIKGIDSYKLDKKSKLVTYAARCIENEILMYFRSNKKNNNILSLNDSIGYDKDGNEINLIDIIKGEKQDYLEIINNKDNINKLFTYLNILNDREKEIIIKRYGLFNTKEYTQKDIAKQLNISRSYVSRIETRALSKMYLEFKKDNIIL